MTESLCRRGQHIFLPGFVGRELRTLTGHSRGVMAVAVTPDGQRVISAWWNNTIKIWEWKHEGCSPRYLRWRGELLCILPTPSN